ncbi:MAG: M4 family metallopeptidase, partial [Cellvibrionaceae bacterium]
MKTSVVNKLLVSVSVIVVLAGSSYWLLLSDNSTENPPDKNAVRPTADNEATDSAQARQADADGAHQQEPSSTSGQAQTSQSDPVDLRALDDVEERLNAAAGTDAERLRDVFRLSEAHDFMELKETADPAGNTHVRYRQTYKEIPFWGTQVVVHKDQENQYYRVNGTLHANLDSTELDGKLSTLDTTDVPPDLMDTIKAREGHTDDRWRTRVEQAALTIYVDDNGRAIPAYEVSYFAEPRHAADADYSQPAALQPTRPHFLIDANSLEIVKAWDGLTHADATGPGGNEKTGRYVYGVDRPHLQVEDLGGTCVMENDKVTTLSMEHSEDQTIERSAFEFPCLENTHKAVNGAYAPLNDVHYYGGVVFDMYGDWFSVTPLTFKMVSRVHHGTYFQNAFWNGEDLTFGDGGSRFYPLTDLNVVSHEAAHGFTAQHSALSGAMHQASAINEAFSDIAGEAAEFYWRGEVDWYVGADYAKAPHAAMRYFRDPPLDGSSIKHLDDYVEGLAPHSNGGLYNHSYYQLATTPGWDPRKAFEPFFHANQNYWGPDEDFVSGACGIIDAAYDLGYDVRDVADAFAVVGIACVPLPFVDEDGDSIDDNWEAAQGLNPADSSDAALDNDGDGLSNLQEYEQRSNPNLADTDGDGLSDFDEWQIHGTSLRHEDTDGDGLSDATELSLGYDPANPDSDGDGMDDGWEEANGLNPNLAGDATMDSDGDGLSNLDEFIANGDPHLADTDGDGLSDGEEVELGTALDRADSDYDGLSDSEEILRGTDPLNSDSDSDYLSDGLEVANGTDPLGVDTDGDGLGDGAEIDVYSTDPFNADSDQDGMPDGWEVDMLLDPLSDDSAGDADEDGLVNIDEYLAGTSAAIADSDGDGLTDGEEVHEYGTDPLNKDSDGDTMPDGWEVTYGFDPTAPDDQYPDADGDGWTAGQESWSGTDPFDPNHKPTVPTGTITVQSSGHGHCYEHGCYQQDVYTYSGWYASTEFRAYLEFELPFNPWTVNQARFRSLTRHYLAPDPEEPFAIYQANIDGPDDFDDLDETDAYAIWERLGDGALYSSGTFVTSVAIALNGSDLNSAGRAALRPGKVSLGVVLTDLLRGEQEEMVAIDTRQTALQFSFERDSDGDGITDEWEVANGFSISDRTDALQDSDDDGLINLQEYIHGTDPHGDTDGDGLPDGWEVRQGRDPFNADDAAADDDGDGLTNLQEFEAGTDPDDADTDGDGLSDGEEVSLWSSDPLAADGGPLVAITAPTGPGPVSGHLQLQGSAWSQAAGIDRVEIYLGSELLGEAEGTTSWHLDWDTSYWPDGEHSIRARVYADNGDTREVLSAVTIENPGAAIFNPITGTPYCDNLSVYCDSLNLLTSRGNISGVAESNQPNTLLTSQCADGSMGAFGSDESLDRLRIEANESSVLAPGVDASITLDM